MTEEGGGGGEGSSNDVQSTTGILSESLTHIKRRAVTWCDNLVIDAPSNITPSEGKRYIKQKLQ